LRTAPVINGEAPPTESEFGLRPTRKGQRSANLMRAHATGRAVAPLNGRGIGLVISQAVKHLMDTSLGTVRIADVHLNDATALAVFDDLNMRQRARDAVAHVGKAASAPVSAGAIGLSENLWEQAGVAGFTVRQQDQAMAIRQTVGPILQQTANQAL